MSITLGVVLVEFLVRNASNKFYENPAARLLLNESRHSRSKRKARS
jgi:hypothetical protein